MKKIIYVGLFLTILLQSCGYEVIQTVEKKWGGTGAVLTTEIRQEGKLITSWVDEVISDSVKQLRYDNAMKLIEQYESVEDFEPIRKQKEVIIDQEPEVGEVNEEVDEYGYEYE